MTARAASSRITSALQKKIQRFYEHLNRGDFAWCYLALDPRLRESPNSVTMYQYVNSLQRFLDRYGTVKVRQIDPVTLHLDEPNRLYNNRDFALALVAWEDERGEAHRFRERWVRDRRGWWYSRNTGLITPEA